MLMNVQITLAERMLFAQIQLEVLFVHANQTILEIRLEVVLILMNVQHQINHVVVMRFVKMPYRDITVNVLRDIVENQMLKQLVNKPTLIFYVQQILIVQIMLNVLKDNVSVKMDLNHKDRFVLISMSVVQTLKAVELIQNVLMLQDLFVVSVKLDMSDHHQELLVKHHVKMLNAVHMPIANQTVQKLTVSAKKDGLLIQVILEPVVLILMSVILFMVHLDDVVLILFVQIHPEDIHVLVQLVLPEIHQDNVLILMNAPNQIDVDQVLLAKTYLDHINVNALREQFLIQIQL